MTATNARTGLRRAVLVGLVGQGVSRSLSPAMHELEGARHGTSYVYRTIDIDRQQATPAGLAELLRAARMLGFDGLNLTHPVKQVVLPMLDSLAPSAQRVGACNTVVLAEDGMVGHNTDVTGFGSAFDESFGTADGARFVLVGAGGAGAAVATALAERPIGELVVVDVDARRARALAEQVASTADGAAVRGAGPDALPGALAVADGAVNATPLGMAAHPGTAFDPALLPDHAWVGDIVYRPTETALLGAARARGLRTMSGLGMAMGQAADAFEIFTGEPADRAAMSHDLMELVAAEAAAHPARTGTQGEEH